MTNDGKHVLIVEDDERLNQMMAELLTNEFYQVTRVYDGISAVDKITALRPDIVLLDMQLPGLNGMDVLRKINGKFFGIIVMITAEKDELLEVSALSLGVHDYLTKPVRPHLLVAKLIALSRLTEQKPAEHSNEIIIQDLRLNTNARTLHKGETFVDVTPSEFDILLYLMQNPSKVINRETVLNVLRNIEYNGLDRSIDMRISALRKKLNDTTPPYKYIKTIRARGYILAT